MQDPETQTTSTAAAASKGNTSRFSALKAHKKKLIVAAAILLLLVVGAVTAVVVVKNLNNTPEARSSSWQGDPRETDDTTEPEKPEDPTEDTDIPNQPDEDSEDNEQPQGEEEEEGQEGEIPEIDQPGEDIEETEGPKDEEEEQQEEGGPIVLPETPEETEIPSSDQGEQKDGGVIIVPEPPEGPEEQPQEEVPPPVKQFKSLSWSNFQGQPNYRKDYLAFCSWSVPYDYKVIINGTSAEIVDLSYKCEIDKSKSWVKRKLITDDLLVHENGHFLIGSLCAMNFKMRVDQATFTKDNYKSEMNSIFKKTLNEYLDMEIDYDKETNHALNPDIQVRWTNELNAKIEALRDYWWF